MVVGVPLGPDDEETAMSAETRAFGLQVQQQSGIVVDYLDESFTSAAAERLMRTRKRKHRRDKAAVDRLAACLLLEAYFRQKNG